MTCDRYIKRLHHYFDIYVNFRSLRYVTFVLVRYDINVLQRGLVLHLSKYRNLACVPVFRFFVLHFLIVRKVKKKTVNM